MLFFIIVLVLLVCLFACLHEEPWGRRGVYFFAGVFVVAWFSIGLAHVQCRMTITSLTSNCLRVPEEYPACLFTRLGRVAIYRYTCRPIFSCTRLESQTEWKIYPLRHRRLDGNSGLVNPPSPPSPACIPSWSALLASCTNTIRCVDQMLYVQAENQLLPLLMTVNTPHFDFASCNFTLKHMSRIDSGDSGLSAEGTGRVFYGTHAGVLRSYTLECNYNTGKVSTDGSCDRCPFTIAGAPPLQLLVVEPTAQSVAITQSKCRRSRKQVSTGAQ